MFEAKERVFRVGSERITLRADFLAGMAYAQIVKSVNKQRVLDGEEPFGDSLEQAFNELLPQLEAYENEEELPDILDPTVFINLAWALSARWRTTSGYNRRHTHESDGKVPTHETMRYVNFMSQGQGQLNDLRPVVFGLVLEALAPPS